MIDGMYNNLKKYRNSLIGIGILWILLFHCRLMTLPLADFIRQIGYGGVDICLYLSGFGIFFSLRKDSKISSFYHRRIVRIIPQYVIVTLIYSVYMNFIGEFTCKDVSLTVSGLFYFISDKMTFNWYIPALLVLYFFSPFLYWYICYFGKKTYKYFAFCLIILVAIVLGLAQRLIDIDRFMTLSTRIPIYFMGMLTAYDESIFNNKFKFKQLMNIFITICSTILLYILIRVNCVELLGKYGLYWYPMFFIVPNLCSWICTLLSWLEKKSIMVWARKFIEYTGRNSLMIYLISVTFTLVAPNVIPACYVKQHPYLYNILLVVLVYLLVEVYNKLIYLIKKKDWYDNEISKQI